MQAPEIPGFAKVWFDDFDGPAGSLPNQSSWTIETPATNNNGESQRYTNSPQNLFLDGSGELCIAPQKDSAGIWTSGRMHGNHSVGCDPNHKMIIAASIRVGQNSTSAQQGIWPAFWTLGDSINHGTQWPTCCEWDIFEWGNDKPQNQATLHQTGADGNHDQVSGFVDFNHGDFHTWAVEVDLSSDDYGSQTLNWTLDGQTYFSFNGTGDTPQQRACWERCAHQAFFPILNVAVGGNFVGNPDAQTQGGVQSGLTVQWVAIYKSDT